MICNKNLILILKNIFAIAVIALFSNISALAQIEKPVSWTFETKQINDTEYDLIFHASINNSWHIYSTQINDDNNGPVPTSIHFNTSDTYKVVGKLQELNTPTTAFDKFFNTTISWFDNKASFKQRITLNSTRATIEGYIEYMACNDEKCLPPTDQDFKFELINTNHTISKGSNTNILYIFISGVIAGLLGLLSPCVYSMIPIVIGYFSKHKKDKAVGYSILYSIFILLIYIFLGFVVTLLFGSDALNNLATNLYFNLAFFIIFVLFALSFFGDFEIRLPSFLTNKTEKLASQQNIVGIFFMAFTLVLVSFSCTVPILGTLLVQIAFNNNFTSALAGIFGFALSVALPFGLLAIFPRFLLNMPKSGVWMKHIKITLGFLELALALKFLSNADLAYHLNILDRDTFLSLWIVIFFSLGLYLLGILKIGDTIDKKGISGFRLLIAMLSLTFSIYMVPGLWGAKLKGISEFLPPISTQKFNVSTNNESSNATKNNRKYADMLYFTPEISSFFDYDEAVRYAKNVNKPVFINFTGHACINCRKMEALVFTHPDIINLLNNYFVVVSLYVDDRTQLNDRTLLNEHNKPIRTIGQLNSYIQIKKFATNSQPFYAIIDPSEKVLGNPRAFDTDIDSFIKFLNESLLIFKQNNG